jgi:hypothetical protein
MTWISNSSIPQASRNEAISSPTPIIQMCFPGIARSCRANPLNGSDTCAAGQAEAANLNVVESRERRG